MLFERIAGIAHATLALSVVPFTLPLLVRALEIGDLLLGERTIEFPLQRLERVRPCRTTRATRHDEAQRPIELRQFFRRETARQLLRQSQPCDADVAAWRLFHVVMDL